MSDEHKDEPESPDAVDQADEEMQETETGYRLPVPSREDFFGNLDKISKPDSDD